MAWVALLWVWLLMGAKFQTGVKKISLFVPRQSAGLRSGPNRGCSQFLTWATVPLCMGGAGVREFSRSAWEGLLNAMAGGCPTPTHHLMGPTLEGFFSFLPSLQPLLWSICGPRHHRTDQLCIAAASGRPSLFLRCHSPTMYTPTQPPCADGLPARSILLATSHRFGSTARARQRQGSRERELPSLWHHVHASLAAGLPASMRRRLDLPLGLAVREPGGGRVRLESGLFSSKLIFSHLICWARPAMKESLARLFFVFSNLHVGENLS
jgi:hypothetical protein